MGVQWSSKLRITVKPVKSRVPELDYPNLTISNPYHKGNSHISKIEASYWKCICNIKMYFQYNMLKMKMVMYIKEANLD